MLLCWTPFPFLSWGDFAGWEQGCRKPRPAPPPDQHHNDHNDGYGGGGGGDYGGGGGGDGGGAIIDTNLSFHCSHCETVRSNVRPNVCDENYSKLLNFLGFVCVQGIITKHNRLRIVDHCLDQMLWQPSLPGLDWNWHNCNSTSIISIKAYVPTQWPCVLSWTFFW